GDRRAGRGRAHQRRDAGQHGAHPGAARDHGGRHRRHLAVRRARHHLGHPARRAHLRHPFQRHEPVERQLQLAADLHGLDPGRRHGARFAIRPREKHMTQSRFHLWLCAAVLLFVGCKRSEPSSEGSAGEPKAPMVSFLLSTLQEERYKKDQSYFEATAKAAGLEASTLSADNDNARQLAQVEDVLARGAKVLVIQPTDSAAAAGYVAKAHAKGAKVVAYDRSIPGADFYVAHDSFRVGVLQAEQAVKATGGKGKYVILAGQSGHSVATEISRGYHHVLKPYVDKGEI